MSERRWGIFAVRTVAGQEYNVALLAKLRAEARRQQGEDPGVYAIVAVPEKVRGVVFFEADNPARIDVLVYGIRHVRGRVPGKTPYSELEKVIKPKPVVEVVEVGDIVEIMSGPLAGMKAKVIDVIKDKNELRVIPCDAEYPLPLTLKAEFVRVVKKGGTC